MQWVIFGSVVNAVVLPFFVQLLKRFLPAQVKQFLKGTYGVWVVWIIACGAAAIQFALQGGFKGINWTSPAEATALVLGIGTAISKAAETIYRTWEPTFKRLVKEL